MSVAVKTGVEPTYFEADSDHSVDRGYEGRRLHRNAITLINAHPEAIHLGADCLVESMAKACGINPIDVPILRIMLAATRYTIVCVPHRLWHCTARKKALLELRRAANEAQRNCVLVPEGFIQREPRLGTSRAIEQSTGVTVSPEDRMRVLLHLVEAGSSTLYDCACVIAHEAPFSCVLHLVAEGIISMDQSRALKPETRIDLPQAA